MMITIKRETEARGSYRVTRVFVHPPVWLEPWDTMETEQTEPRDMHGVFAASKYPPPGGWRNGETHHALVRPWEILGPEHELGGLHVRRESQAPRRIYWMIPPTQS